MMARSPSLPLSEYGELSSPDPLNSSQQKQDYGYTTRSPSPEKRTFSSPTKRQRVGSSISATTPRTSRSQWMNATSPSKTVTEQTMSPWKIRVTVETEPEDMNTDADVHDSRTIMVPLHDTSSPCEEQAGTTRGRGSQPTAAKSKRSATPVRKNNRSRSRRQSVTDLNITVLGDEGDSNDWTKQRSPRKRKPAPSGKPQFALACEGIDKEQQPTTGKTRRRTTRSARSIEIRDDTDMEEGAVVDMAMESDSPELRSIDLNRVSVRSRSMSVRHQPANLASQDTGVSQEEAERDKDVTEDDSKHVSVISTSYPTPDPSVQDDQDINEPVAILPDDHEGFDTILESEGFTMIDLGSIPSARHFFSSPSESQGAAVSPEPTTDQQINDEHPAALATEQATPSAAQPAKSVSRAIPSYLLLPEGESDISSNVPSSPPVLSQLKRTVQSSSDALLARESTPQVYSSPKLPSPPKVIHPDRSNSGTQLRKSTTPTLAKVVKAGIALQGVLSPKLSNTRQSTSGGTPEERLNDLFEGFDSGTRRELRAGLRFGEELAKRQRSSPNARKSVLSEGRSGRAMNQIDRDRVCAGKHVPVTQVWRGETLVPHTPVQLTLGEEKANNLSDMEFTKRDSRSARSQLRKRSSLCRETSFTSPTPQTNTTDVESRIPIDSQSRRELQWQREREAVSTEIEMASSSQVIVIHSDDDDQNLKDINSDPAEEHHQRKLDDLDIWCEEAASCDQRSSKGAVKPIRASRVNVSLEAEQKQQQGPAQEANVKPRRSVIPSPWRRRDDVAGENSYLTAGDMTGLFYHDPKTKIKFGAAEIERQKRQFSSGSFDIDRMAGTPRKNHVLDSQVSVQEAYSPETIDSDAQQLQTELSMNRTQVDDTTDASEAVPREISTQQSFVGEAEVEHFETVSQLSKGNTSLSLPPQSIKIPVNFNDSTNSDIAPCLTRSSPSTAPESSRPSTPRSALKGARQNLGLEDVNSLAVRKVVFSTHEIRVDLDGQEEQMSMQSVSSNPEASPEQSHDENSTPFAPEATEDSPPRRSGLLGWLWSGSKNSKSNAPSSVDGANDQAIGRHTIQASIAQKPPRSGGNVPRDRTPSYLLPPSYPSDPTRDTEVPMATSGEFSNTHFRTLHIIYAKSLRPRFHAPKPHEVRPNLRSLLGTAFEADESQSGLGVFEWKVDVMALRILERFMREVEWGYPADDTVEWRWSEKEICERLFRIVVGEEVRKEEKTALEQVLA